MYIQANNCTNKLLSSNQFDFRAGRSSEFAVILFIDEICKNMNKEELMGVIFLDLSKACMTR